MENYLKLVIAILIPFCAGAVGSYFTFPEIDSWYQLLAKPSFNPPNWIFGPVWSFLYLLIGISFYLIWKEKEISKNLSIYKYFFIQLVLNTSWSLVFFGLKNIFFALLLIIVLWFSILLTILSFYKVSRISAYLLIPYLIWVSFATILNYYVYILN
ncbi:MAG: tryptophan-rich sensory protein [Candidatus Micrarchaeota archaeon]|nr:tryptophan-rich sensory protein [Candidatus Micrarchaeota archaeon]